MMEEQEKLDLSIYFVSEEHKYVFYYLSYQGKAKEWYHRIAKIVHPDTCKLPDCEKAVAKLNELYAGMVKEDE